MRHEQTLFASVLIHYYALAESAAMTCLSANARDFNGIEEWGPRLLARRDRTWADVEDGLGGAVEVAVVRNAYVHGNRAFDTPGVKRLKRAGVHTRAAGEPVSVGYSELQLFRERLKSLLKAGGV